MIVDCLELNFDELRGLEQEIGDDHLIDPVSPDISLAQAKTSLVSVEGIVKNMDLLIEEMVVHKTQLKAALVKSGIRADQITAIMRHLTPLGQRLQDVNVLVRRLRQQEVCLKTKIDALTPVVPPQQFVAPPPPQAPVIRTAQLPQLTLVKFSGKRDEFQKWFEMFRVSVDEQPDLPAVTKFAHLQTLLEGQPLKLMEGLGFDETGYAQALELLDKEYGKKSKT
jgi:hypothetical protein